MGLATGVVGAYAAEKVVGPAAQQWEDDWHSHMSNAEFLSTYRDNISRTHFGASFSPEKFGVRLGKHGKVIGPADRAVDAFRFAVDTLGLKYIRLGIQWDNAVDDNNDINLAVYQPIIDYGLSNGVEFCKNFGYKSIRYPEQHPSAQVKQSGIMLPKGETVTIDTQFAQEALQYTDALAVRLSREYGKSIPMVQPENEPFQKFGEYDQDLGRQYMEASIGIIRDNFPHARVLINAGGAVNVEKVVPFIARLTEKKPEMRGQLVSGIDLHLDKPGMNPLWDFLGFDTMTVDEIVNGDVYSWHKRTTQSYGIPSEISEVGVEQWGDVTSPLYSINKLHKAVLRSWHIVDYNETPTIRFWGVEDQYNVVTQQGISPETGRRIEFFQELTANQAA